MARRSRSQTRRLSPSPKAPKIWIVQTSWGAARCKGGNHRWKPPEMSGHVATRCKDHAWMWPVASIIKSWPVLNIVVTICQLSTTFTTQLFFPWQLCHITIQQARVNPINNMCMRNGTQIWKPAARCHSFDCILTCGVPSLPGPTSWKRADLI